MLKTYIWTGRTMNIKATAVLALLGLAAEAQNANQGVSKEEIVLWSIQDLSGPIASYGKLYLSG
jgi:branched-chain amino acid transport system substrate-binding protein